MKVNSMILMAGLLSAPAYAGETTSAIFQDQDTAEEWLGQYENKPEEGRSELIKLARDTSLENGELERIIESDARGPLQGLATSVLHERKRNGEYDERLSFDADWAGAYITVAEDYWGANTLFIGDNALFGATVEGDYALHGATVKGYGALDGATVEGDCALADAFVEGDYALHGATVKGYGALDGATVEGSYALRGASVEGYGALYHATVKGDGALHGVTVTGYGALRYATVEGDDTLRYATVEGDDTLRYARMNGKRINPNKYK